MLILEEMFRWQFEASASELFIYIQYIYDFDVYTLLKAYFRHEILQKIVCL